MSTINDIHCDIMTVLFPPLASSEAHCERGAEAEIRREGGDVTRISERYLSVSHENLIEFEEALHNA
jgi:hypothetical protein